jgi:uracil-DNA glycosylase family 4
MTAVEGGRAVRSGPARAGSGWPGDQADATTPVAADPDDVRRLAASARALDGPQGLTARSSVCRACPRLVAWRETIAIEKRRAFADEPYWGRPIPGWGTADPRVLIVGLAPAAHGGNRTGRIFTGDRSGDWLFASLHRVGLATQATSIRADDDQRLVRTRMVAAVRCAPPANKPLPAERDACAQWLDREVALVLRSGRAVVALGAFAWAAALGTLARNGYRPSARTAFGHGAEVDLVGSADADSDADTGADASRTRPTLLGSYHPSQQNTFTGRLTEAMLDDLFHTAKRLAAGNERTG